MIKIYNRYLEYVKLVKRYRRGLCVTEICDEMGIQGATARQWVRNMCSQGIMEVRRTKISNNLYYLTNHHEREAEKVFHSPMRKQKAAP
jgi:Mn-dependent DtxR family transcriptional regulator